MDEFCDGEVGEEIGEGRGGYVFEAFVGGEEGYGVDLGEDVGVEGEDRVELLGVGWGGGVGGGFEDVALGFGVFECCAEGLGFV